MLFKVGDTVRVKAEHLLHKYEMESATVVRTWPASGVIMLEYANGYNAVIEPEHVELLDSSNT